MENNYGLKEIGKRIKSIRNELRLSQKEFGKNIGLEQYMVSKIENGKRLPTTLTLIKLAKISGKSIDFILFGK